ncbi:uncharacterized protein LOC143614585 [Bidens hawaiensis]|uniref:uncharacterized protein LOC143614585 n=1 Tax=Bidens hawaiensis TaxID=980011 RepID=UPI00404B2154
MAMGEEPAAAPCLMRSVSQPVFASREFKEGDPLRALTTSVSFGRFVNEPLDWEKWSSFSHNRILEDVQKHSRPGVVAERKAFFEAYFNKSASKKSSKSFNKENRRPNYPPLTNKRENQSPTVANRVAASEITSNQDVSSPSNNLVLSEKRNVDNIISSGGRMKHEKASTANVSSPIVLSNRGAKREISSNEDVRSPLINLVLSEKRNADDIITSGGRMKQEKTSTANVSSPLVLSDRGAKREVSSNENVRSPLTNLVLVETENAYSEVDNVDENVSSNKGAEGEITSKKEFSSCATNLVFAEVANIDDIISSGEQMEQENISTGNVTSENHCLEVLKQSSHVDKNKKRHIKDKISGHTKTDISSVKSSSRKALIPEILPKNQIFKHNPKMSSVNVVKKNTQPLPKSEKKRSKPLFDYSVNVNETVVLKKSTQALTRSENKRSKPLLDRTVNANNTAVLKKNTQPLSISDNKRSKPLVDRSVNANKTVVLKKNTQPLPRSEIKWSKPLLDRLVNGNKKVVLKSHSTNHTEAALTASTKKPRSVTVPSSFTFKSDERAAKRKQFSQKLEEKTKLKEKAKGDDRKLRWSTALEAKTSTSETKGPSNKLQKVEPTRKRPQKLGKNFIEINKKSLSSSMACLPSKKSH